MAAQNQKTFRRDEAIRFCFNFKAQDIPGEPGARSITAANAFMQQHFERDFSWQTDYVYTPAGIDDVEEGKKGIPFMFLDVNKHANPTFQSLHCFKIIKCGKAMYDALYSVSLN
jgi:hypothetical protein